MRLFLGNVPRSNLHVCRAVSGTQTFHASASFGRRMRVLFLEKILADDANIILGSFAPPLSVTYRY